MVQCRLIFLTIVMDRKENLSVATEQRRYSTTLHNYILARDNSLVPQKGNCHVCMISFGSDRVLAWHWKRVHANISVSDNYSMLVFLMSLSGCQANMKTNYIIDRKDPIVEQIFTPRSPRALFRKTNWTYEDTDGLQRS